LLRQIENQIAQAQAWLSTWGRPETVKLVREADQDWAARPVYKASMPPISRRDLLRGLKRRNPVKDPLSVAEGNQPFRERLRLLLALQQWPIPTGINETDRILPEVAGFSLLTVDDRCSACGTCTRACPVGALELKTGDGHFRLNFAPKACVGCDICAHLCPEQAIAVNHTPRIGEVFGEDEILQLHTGRFSKCERCHSPFVPADPASKLCSLCEFRRQNPFGARTPPALLWRQQRTHTSQDRE
jgi:NAD-dependent dihydropyrimidine dehydrogenase PreA subunit